MLAGHRPSGPELVLGRYSLHTEIASGGMASVYLGRLLGPVGFSRTVAIKRLHPQYGRDPEFVAMFLDEARFVTRVRHPNVVQTLDVVKTDSELFIVMEYVEGEPLSKLVRAARECGERMPARIVGGVMSAALVGLHAAHEARDERGAPLGIIHRDVSPQNLLVGSDGVVRVLDFGVAKALRRIQATTRDGSVKGKLAYMAPEQLMGDTVTRTADIYAMGVVMWEALTGARRFDGDEKAIVASRALEVEVERPSARAPGIPPALDDVVLRALCKRPGDRFSTALEMAMALEKAMGPASVIEIGAWVNDVAKESLARRAAQVAAIEGAADIPSRRSLNQAIAELAPADPGAVRLLEKVGDPAESTARIAAVAAPGVAADPTRRYVPPGVAPADRVPSAPQADAQLPESEEEARGAPPARWDPRDRTQLHMKPAAVTPAATAGERRGFHARRAGLALFGLAVATLLLLLGLFYTHRAP
jgi:serine/threonine-protein kinase